MARYKSMSNRAMEEVSMSCFRLAILGCLVLLLSAHSVSANAFVRGAYYRLGDDDPGAAASQLGQDPTRDSFSDGLDLTRFGAPRYSADVPPRGPLPNKLSMAFVDFGAGAISSGYY